MKNKSLIIPLLMIFLLAGCMTYQKSLSGLVVAEVSGPVGSTSDINASKHKSKKAYSILGLISWGDASIKSAREFTAQGIPRHSRISHVDYEIKYIFGIAIYRTVSYGLLR